MELPVFGEAYKEYRSLGEVLRDIPLGPVVVSAAVALLPLAAYGLARSRRFRHWVGALSMFLDRLRGRLERRAVEREVRHRVARWKGKRTGVVPALLLFALFSFIAALFATRTVFFGVVTSDSMYPTLQRGDIVLLERVSNSIKPGDIVLIQPPNFLNSVVHRVESISNGEIRTKGDNSGPDPWSLPHDRVLGRALLWGGKPVAAKNLGAYFLPPSPYLAQDPTYLLVKGAVGVLQKTGPLLAALFFFLAALGTVSRRRPWPV